MTNESETAMTMEFETTSTTESPSRSRPSRRMFAGLGAAMLVAAAGGIGFGIGRNVDRSDQVNTAAGADDAASTAVTTAVEEPAPNGTVASTDETAPASTDAPSETLPALGRASADVVADEAASAGAIRSSGSAGYSMFGTEPMELLFERTTAAGLNIRAQLGALWPTDEFGYGQDGWQAPGWCFQSGEVRLAMTGGGIIDVGSVGWFSEPFQGRSASWLTLGRVDGSPHRVVFAQVPDATSLVTATFGDGATDSTTPQNGVAILVVPGEPETILHDQDQEYGGWTEELPDFTITFAGAGSDAGDVTVAHDEIGTWNDPEYAASCSPPPPALPDPGEQPADPAAAESEIKAAMSQLYGGQAEGDDDASSLNLLDDPTGVAEAREQVRVGGYETEASNAEAIVEELVFTTPTEAWFRYRVETGGIGLNERYGIAVQIDGVWLITRATLCQDLSMAGGSCGDDVNITIRPPGFEYVEEAFVD